MTDWDAEGLLEGLESEADRDGRRRLLDSLYEDGVPIDELRRAVAEDRLALVRIERMMLGEKRYSMREVAERTGRDVEWLSRYRRTIGLAAPGPDECAYGEADVEDALRGRTFTDAGMSDDLLLATERIIGRAMSQYAAAFRLAFAETFMEPGDTESEVADRYAAAFQALEPLAGPHFAHLFFLHLRELVRDDVISAEERRAGKLGDRDATAVAFVDVVGFTELGESIGHERLSGVAGRLEDLATEAAAPPVRLVKAIGDAVMLVAPEPPALVEAALALVESAESAELPPLRAGIAYGPAVNRFGDWYGSTVNLASRLTERARPASVLVSEPAREAAAEAFDWSYAGEKRLKGFSRAVKAYRARREPAAE